MVVKLTNFGAGIGIGNKINAHMDICFGGTNRRDEI